MPRSSRKSSGGSSVPRPTSSVTQRSRAQHQTSSDRDSDYDLPLTKGERLRKEKMLSMLATKQRQSVDDSSGDSRPVSVNSSLYSAESESLSSSPGGSKTGLGSTHQSLRDDPAQNSLEKELEMIDKLVADVALQNTALTTSMSSAAVEENLSVSGSNDNLGVWDDLNTDEDSDEPTEGVCVWLWLCVHVCGWMCVLYLIQYRSSPSFH